MTEPVIYRFLVAIVLLAFVFHRRYYMRKYPPAEAATVDKLRPGIASRIASLLSVVALVATVVYVISPAWVAWAALALPAWARWLGVVIALLGFGLLEWSQRSLGQEWSEQPRITQSQRLIQSGPYRWIRHPIYASFLLILGSTLLISANALVGLAWIGSVGIDAAVRIRYEETRMSARFGEAYLAYGARTGRLIPRLWKGRVASDVENPPE
jgi:protein-S-isoprenylcysteine O-methyltransferase Ste14